MSSQPWKWICEFCFRLLYVNHLPNDWDWVFQSAVCPLCMKRVECDGGYYVVPGGAYATGTDPRSIFITTEHRI